MTAPRRPAGARANVVRMDPDRDIVAVVRWIHKPKVDGFCARVLAALGMGAARN